MADAPELVHGTCVALGRTAALLRGPSGSGKSDLALRFLFLARRGPAALEAPILVADDQVYLTRKGARLAASGAGRPSAARSRCAASASSRSSRPTRPMLALVVDLVARRDIERLPDENATTPLLGLDIPLLRLSPWEASAPIKLAVALPEPSTADPRLCTHSFGPPQGAKARLDGRSARAPSTRL